MKDEDPSPTATRLIEGVSQQIKIYESTKIFLDTFAKVPREHGLLYAVWWCDYEVCNGGFIQFFENSTGILAPEAIEGYIATGQSKLADLVAKATEKLSIPFARDRSARWAALRLLPKDAFDELAETYYQLKLIDGGGFDAAIERFARNATKLRGRYD